jgi:hypothetical protein
MAGFGWKTNADMKHAARRCWSHISARPEVFAGLVALTLALGMTACSSDSKPVAVRKDSQLSQTRVSATNVSAPAENKTFEGTGTPVRTRGRATRSVAKKRPETMPFRDSNYGLAFRYPWQYSLRTHAEVQGESTGPAMKFVQPGGVRVAEVEVPSSYYPNSDLQSALFSVSLHRKMTAEDCGQFAAETKSEKGGPENNSDNAGSPSKALVGGMEAVELDEVSGLADTSYYHVFDHGACYEFALSLTTSEAADVMPVNHDKVFDRLGKMLDTVEIESQQTPEETTASSTAAMNQNH